MSCQLAAYVGEDHLSSLLLRSLELQEPYDGGHATGMAALSGDGINLVKAAGPVSHVRTRTRIGEIDGTCGIAHSRYSKRARDIGGYNLDRMAHPYLSDDGKIALMHNGTITNYGTLWRTLEADHTFRSYGRKVDDITDSEVAVHMLSDAYDSGMTMVEAFRHIAPKIAGMFLLAAIHVDHPNTLYICNWYQPCYLALGKNEAMFASSRRGLIGANSDRVFQPPKNSIITLKKTGVEIHAMDGRRQVPCMTMRESLAEGLIRNMLKERARLDVRELFDALNPDGWAEAFSMSVDEWLGHRAAGICVMNPYYELLETMVADGIIEESIDLRTEGGFENVPRYSYVLANAPAVTP